MRTETVKFSQVELQAARQLRDAGLHWSARPGLYIWDELQRIRPGSPFQSGVYFLHDVDCFCEYFGGKASLESSVVWLPTWEQAIACLRQRSSTATQDLTDIAATGHLELVELYHLLEQSLRIGRDSVN